MTSKKKKTNREYILFICLLMIAVGFFVWLYLGQKDSSLPEPSELNQEDDLGKTEEEIQVELDDAALKCFCENEVQEFWLDEWGQLTGAEYTQERVDLNEDGANEVIAMGSNCLFENYSFFTGGVTGNQIFCIFQRNVDQWQEIGYIGGEGYLVEESKTNGYFDLTTNANGGWAGCLRVITNYSWDGSYYSQTNEESKNVCEELEN